MCEPLLIHEQLQGTIITTCWVSTVRNESAESTHLQQRRRLPHRVHIEQDVFPALRLAAALLAPPVVDPPPRPRVGGRRGAAAQQIVVLLAGGAEVGVEAGGRQLQPLDLDIGRQKAVQIHLERLQLPERLQRPRRVEVHDLPQRVRAAVGAARADAAAGRHQHARRSLFELALHRPHLASLPLEAGEVGAVVGDGLEGGGVCVWGGGRAMCIRDGVCRGGLL